MKKSGLFAASVAAAATATASASPASSSNYARCSKPHPCSQEEGGKDHRSDEEASERFAPRFDGLRFIETLVTAHR